MILMASEWRGKSKVIALNVQWS